MVEFIKEIVILNVIDAVSIITSQRIRSISVFSATIKT